MYHQKVSKLGKGQSTADLSKTLHMLGKALRPQQPPKTKEEASAVLKHLISKEFVDRNTNNCKVAIFKLCKSHNIKNGTSKNNRRILT